MKLSILMASLVGREYYLNRMLSLLEPQLTSEVELILEIDDKKLSVGAKSQKMLERAKGDYICYIDDDDIIPAYYILEILKAIESKPDCVAVNGILTIDDKNPQPFYHSIKYDDWISKDYKFYRCPNHINPVKRELALKAGWDDLKTGGDYTYSLRLKPFLKTETVIDKVMYYYLAKSATPVGRTIQSK